MTRRTGKSATGALTCGTRCSRPGPTHDPFTTMSARLIATSWQTSARPSTPGINFRLIWVFDSVASVASPLPALVAHGSHGDELIGIFQRSGQRVLDDFELRM